MASCSLLLVSSTTSLLDPVPAVRFKSWRSAFGDPALEYTFLGIWRVLECKFLGISKNPASQQRSRLEHHPCWGQSKEVDTVNVDQSLLLQFSSYLAHIDASTSRMQDGRSALCRCGNLDAQN